METWMMATTCPERPPLMIAVPTANTGQTAAADLPHVTCKIAGTLEERVAAFRLVYDNYLQAGLIDPNPDAFRVTPYHLLPTTNVFIAEAGGEVICTVTLIGDGQLGLPMESIYSAEVNAARSQGLYVGEVSCLAFQQVQFKQFLAVFVQLTRLMAQHARAYGMDQFLIAIHPRHARFYERFMGFKRIGNPKQYPSVRNAPAVALCLDFSYVDRHRPACYDQYFKTPMPMSELRPQRMSAEEIDYFRTAAETSEQWVPMTV